MVHSLRQNMAVNKKENYMTKREDVDAFVQKLNERASHEEEVFYITKNEWKEMKEIIKVHQVSIEILLQIVEKYRIVEDSLWKRMKSEIM